MNRNYNKEDILNSNKLREQIWIKISNKRFDMKCSIEWCPNHITTFNFKLQTKMANDYSTENLIPVCNRCYIYINKHGYRKWSKNIESSKIPVNNLETKLPVIRDNLEVKKPQVIRDSLEVKKIPVIRDSLETKIPVNNLEVKKNPVFSLPDIIYNDEPFISAELKPKVSPPSKIKQVSTAGNFKERSFVGNFRERSFVPKQASLVGNFVPKMPIIPNYFEIKKEEKGFVSGLFSRLFSR
jgi:hypothetical protein